mgnify:CR=1 FL=1
MADDPAPPKRNRIQRRASQLLQELDRQVERRNSQETPTPTTAHRVLLTGPPTVLSKGLPGLAAVEEPDLQLWLRKLEAYDGSKPTKAAAEAADPINPPKTRTRRRSR